jgi:hypothetical protein
MMIAFSLLAFGAVSPATPASDAAARTAIEAYIQACETEWAQGAVRDNGRDVARFIADDYHGVSSRGKVVNKAQMTASEAPEGRSAGLYYAKTHFITPALAIVQGEEWWEPKKPGRKHHLIWTDTWLFRDGAWRIVASQDSTLPANQPVQN